MERFNPDLTLTSSETADLFAVHASTVKRWCNDGEIPSEKTVGGHRRIHLEDAMAFARDRGIRTVLSPFHPYEPHVWTALQEIRESGSFRRLHSLAMGWVARGDMRRVSALYDAVARDPAVTFCAFCDNGIRGLMAQVGEAWAQGRLRIADEHLVTQVMTEVLMKFRVELRDQADRDGHGGSGPVAVVGTLEGNQHHLGSLCIRILLELEGWDVCYLGPDVPVEEFAVIQRGRDASLVCAALPPFSQPGDVARAVRILAEFYDPDRPYSLALGGGVPADLDPALLAGPFVAAESLSSCASLQEVLRHDFVPALSGAIR